MIATFLVSSWLFPMLGKQLLDSYHKVEARLIIKQASTLIGEIGKGKVSPQPLSSLVYWII